MSEEEKEVMTPEKPKRGRPKGKKDTDVRKVRKDHEVRLEKGTDDNIMNIGVEILQAPKIDLNDRQQVIERIAWYFQMCQKYVVKPGTAGVCASLGISRTTWFNWGISLHREYADIVEKTRNVLETFMENYMQQGRINPVSGIFLMKNNFGYADKNELVVTPNQNPLGEGKTAEELAKKYADAAYIDSDNTAEELEKKYSDDVPAIETTKKGDM